MLLKVLSNTKKDLKYFYDPPKVIKIAFKNFIWNTSNSKILLTFDDGPIPETTEIILKCLNKNKINAVFFCVGNNVKNYPELCKNIISEGHLIGNHTFNHKKIINLNKKEIDEEIDSFNNLLNQKFNCKIRYFRPPHGKFNFSTSKIMREKNLKNIMWSLLSYDYKNDINLVKFVVNKYLQKNSIVVLHDSKKSKEIIEDSIKIIIDETYKKGFEIGKPDECLK